MKWLSLKFLMVASGVMAATIGCATSEQGPFSGHGLGALVLGAVGEETPSARVGADYGTGIGYVIGNEADKEKARQMTLARANSHQEVGPLGGTKWKLVELVPLEFVPPFTAKVFDFGSGGHLYTTTAYPDGKVDLTDEIYRVVGDTLIINRPGYIINAKFEIRDNQMNVHAQEFKATLVPFSPTNLTQGDFRCDDISFKEADADMWVEGTIENRSGADYEYVVLYLPIYDLAENVIGSSSFMLHDFGNSAKQPFRTLVLGGNKSKMASFKLEYSVGQKK